jgi:vitamin B12/bleomycin/antimicrobial peptide transport system ATP-binding/permease protein
MNAMEQAKPPLRFRFDRKLWNRFVEVAQPYFYPAGPRSSWHFLLLAITQLIFVVAFTFFFIIALALIGFQFTPEFFPGLINEIIYLKFIGSLGKTPAGILQGLINFPAFYIFTVLLLISGGVYFAYRRKLRGRERQWIMLGSLLFLAFLVSSLNVLISYVFRFIDNSFVQKNPKLFWEFLTVYGITIFIAIPIIVGYIYIRGKLSLFWREWLTKVFISKYLEDRSYYELDSNSVNTDIDNPDQRITQDIDSFTSTVLSLILDVLTSVLDIVAFTGILLSISRELTLGLLGYVLVGSIVAIVITVKFIALRFNQLRLEGDFRYGMVHIRDSAESIAFYRGENLEEKQVERRLGSVINNANLIIIWSAFQALFQRAYSYFSRLIPYIIVAPLFFAGKVDFGTITQSTIAFSVMFTALSILVNQIQDISLLAASVERLGGLYERFQDHGAKARVEGEQIQNHLSTHFKVSNLTLRTPNSEQTLFQNLSFEVAPNQSLLVVGASGCGKSSLLRAIAGLWRNGSGTIEGPDMQEILFLPQQPYMLLGTLREQLTYPNLRENISDSEIQEALQIVNLEDLPERMGGLEAEKDWVNTLSVGEQQRLAFARILLSQPKYVILDEATSALDITNERRLYGLLQSMGISYISVGHRPSLVDYHQTVLDLGAENGWQLYEASRYQFAD